MTCATITVHCNKCGPLTVGLMFDPDRNDADPGELRNFILKVHQDAVHALAIKEEP